MALTDENTNGMVMPVAPMYGGGNGSGFGFGGDWAWILLLLVLFGGWGNGNGNGAGWNGGSGLYPWMNQSNQISDGFRDQMLGSQISGIQNSITAGFGDVQNALCGGFAGVNASIAGAQSSLAAQLAANEMASLERSFAVQTASTAGMTSLQAQLAQCCCDNRLATCQTQNALAAESAATRNAIQGGIQTILDKMCQDKIDEKNDQIAQLRSELMYARGQASQDVQTAAIQAGQRALANEVEQYVLPTPRPAYIVQNPNCCAPNYGCGCGA